MNCTHPKHKDGESCVEHAVGCNPNCACCLGEEQVKINQTTPIISANGDGEIIFANGDIPAMCPHCRKDPSGGDNAPIKDFVVPGRVGDESAAEDRCYDCNKPFIAMKNPSGTFSMLKSC